MVNPIRSIINISSGIESASDFRIQLWTLNTYKNWYCVAYDLMWDYVIQKSITVSIYSIKYGSAMTSSPLNFCSLLQLDSTKNVKIVSFKKQSHQWKYPIRCILPVDIVQETILILALSVRTFVQLKIGEYENIAYISPTKATRSYSGRVDRRRILEHSTTSSCLHRD